MANKRTMRAFYRIESFVAGAVISWKVVGRG